MRPAAAVVAGHLVAFGAGYLLAPKEPVDREARHTGFFQLDRSRVLSTVVESLREENDLAVFSYKGAAEVEADRTKWWLLGGHQKLIVPAVVTYRLPLSDLSLADVTYDDRAKLVRVRLPRLTVGDVAFAPEEATTINGGLLTYSDEQVEALRKMNYAQARRAIVAQAQQPGLLRAARRQAVADVEQYFSIPLRVAGMPDVRVAAAFD